MPNPFEITEFQAPPMEGIINPHEQFGKILRNSLRFMGVTQEIIGKVPAKSNCYRIVTFKSKDPDRKTYPTLAKGKELKDYEKSFWAQCNLYRNANIKIPFKITIDVYFERQASDLDNAAKVILDCLQAVNAIENDNLCAELRMRKFIDKANPRILFKIENHNPIENGKTIALFEDH